MKLSRHQFLHLAASAAALPAVSRIARAQTSTEGVPPKKGTRVITLGTKNGPSPTVGRAQSSNLLVVNGAQYIIDAGDGVTRRLARLGTNFRNIDNIFITHPHSDHTSGLGALMTVVYDARRTNLVNIYGPPGTAASVKGLLDFLTVSSEIRISDGTQTVPATKVFSGHDTGVGIILQDANVKVTAVENTHFHFPPGTPAYGKYKSYSYRFDAADRSVVFTGDTGPSNAVAELAKGADLLVAEDEWSGHNTLGAFAYDTPLATKETVRTERLDDIVLREGLSRVDVVKLDVEGAELLALKGAIGILERFRPLLLLELADRALCHQGSNSAQIWDFCCQRGYQIFAFDQFTGFPVPAQQKPYYDSENIVAVPNSYEPATAWRIVRSDE